MSEPMHRIKYTKLTKDQIDQKLLATASGPACASEYSEVLAGKSLKILTDNGPILSYAFKSKNRLTLAEDGGAPVESGYGALTLKQVVFFSHMVPKTQKGYNIVVDLNSNLATVFEVWFSGYKDDNREVQRQMYYGYVEVAGREAPKERHHLTNRIEGKAFHWTQDKGIETLEFYPSVIFSSFIELTRHSNELMYCGPSDFIMINENMYIYDRTECVMSGIMTMYVLDLSSLKQIGVRLGFDEKDALEYYMFRGTGEILGQVATFEPFRDHGEKIVMGPNKPQTAQGKPQTPEKGERRVYRPLLMNPPMTEEEVNAAVQKSTRIFGGGIGVVPSGTAGSEMAGNKLPSSDFLVGKEFTLRYDNGGPVYNYRFDELKKLRWRREGEGQWNEEIYEAFEPAEELILFAHMHSGTRPSECVEIALDFRNGLTTCVSAKLGTPYMANEVSRDIIFGIIEMKGLDAPRYWRHTFTDELVGHAFTWNYSDAMSSMHVYSTPQSYSWTIFMENGTMGMMWSSPCHYVKLRDYAYLFEWMEEACNGHHSTIVINTRTMRECGFGFGVGRNGLSLSDVGAYARNAGFYDIKRFLGPKGEGA
jgi:hypothetical protein